MPSKNNIGVVYLLIDSSNKEDILVNKIRPAVVDFDDTLIHLTHGMVLFANRLFGANVQYEDVYSFYLPEIYQCTKAEIDAMLELFFLSEEHEALLPIEGVTEGLQYLKETYGTIHIATARPITGAASMVSLLKRHNLLRYISVMYVGLPKGEVCHKVDAAICIDDAIHNIHDIIAKSPRTSCVLMERPWSKTPVPEAQRVHTWHDIIAQKL